MGLPGVYDTMASTMNARSAARELALLTLFQMEKQGDLPAGSARLPKVELKELVLDSVRALAAEAEDKVQSAADQLADVSRMLIDYEETHPENLARPMEAQNLPVPIPTTRDMVEKIEQCLQGAEYLFEALRIPEMLALAEQEEVQAYALKLIGLILDHQAALDDALNRHMEEWRMDRLVKMDRYILRLAAAEMLHVASVDAGVSINEAVELAKQYSSEESYRLINGVLGGLADELAQAPTGSAGHV